MAPVVPRYRSVSAWLKELFREPVRKITIDAGLGCPNRDGTLSSGGCIYCNPRGSGTGASGQGISVAEQVDRGIEFLSSRYGVKKFIAYFQSFTNTYAEPEQLSRLYKEASHRPEIVGMAIGTRPDCVAEPILGVLEEMSRQRLLWVEYGLQSVHKRTLDLINRGHGPEAFFDAVQKTRRRGIPTVVHLILGLPGESIEDMIQTARAVADAGVQGVKLHPLYVVQGTALEAMFKAGEYVPMTEESAAESTLAVMEVLPEEMVIHRMTSDPHREELVAPLWMLDRKGVRTRLNAVMQKRDFRQGSLYLESCETQMSACEGEKLKSEATPTKK